MGVLVPSLVLSICAVCVTGAKLYMLAWRRYHGDYNMRVDFGLSYLLLVINILLLVFSIVRIEIALEVLLSLANGALILYQFMWAWQFSFLDQGLRKFIAVTQMLCVITVCVLTPVIPYTLKKGHKGSHIAGLCFFAMEYVLLFIFYGHIFLTSYRKPKHGKQGEDTEKIHDIVVFNMVLSSSAFIAAIPSLILYAKEVVDFEGSLWIKYGVAAVWFVRWVLMQYTSKYNLNALWFVRWVLLQYTSKYNFNALWFWRWLQFAAANADSGIPSVATNEPLCEGSATFRFTATDADSKTPSFATNEAPPMGSEVTLPSPVHRDMLSHPFEPNRDSGILVMGLDICGAHLSPSAASHKGWETIGETAGKRPPCKLTATAYLQRWGRGSPRQRDPSNMETRIPRKRIHPSDADTAGRGATPELAGNDSDYGGEHYPPCSCTDLDDSGLLGAPCPICGHLFFTNIR